MLGKPMKAMGNFKRIGNSTGPTGRKSPSHTIENEKSTFDTFKATHSCLQIRKSLFSGHSSIDANPTFKNVIEPLQRLAKSTSFTRFDIRSTVVAKGEKPINQVDESLQGTIEKKNKSYALSEKKSRTCNPKHRRIIRR